MTEPGPTTDEGLARRVQSGCPVSFAELDRRYRARLLLLLRRRVGCVHDAEDLTQLALLRAYEKIDTYDPRRPFKPWLFTIAVRLSIDKLRRPARHTNLELHEHHAAQQPDPLELAESAERRSRVWSIADRVLGERQRMILWLAYVEQLTPGQIGKVVGMSGVHVRVTLHRARKALAPHVMHLLDENPSPEQPALMLAGAEIEGAEP